MVDMSRSPSVTTVVIIGLLALASGMGVGRFAFTPLLPLMQEASGLSLQHGSWLASANYTGYLIGALVCFALDLKPGVLARTGLLGVAVLTCAMGLTDELWFWLAMRLLAGVASAFVLIGVSSWAMAALARHGRTTLPGWVFAGVGFGIIYAGMIGLTAGATRYSPDAAWVFLGASAAAVFLTSWRPLQHHIVASSNAGGAARAPLTPDAWLLVTCYGTFGFGYIIPATFLPALGRQLVDDPLVFGWVWPIFGVAGAASTIAASRWLQTRRPRQIVACGLMLMAVGVLAPIVSTRPVMVIVSALCVGGTFMVVTMAGFEEARVISGNAAPRVIAGMTTAFAIGQLAGPLTVQSGSIESALVAPSGLASALLLLGAAVLLRGMSTGQSISRFS